MISGMAGFSASDILLSFSLSSPPWLTSVSVGVIFITVLFSCQTRLLGQLLCHSSVQVDSSSAPIHPGSVTGVNLRSSNWGTRRYLNQPLTPQRARIRSLTVWFYQPPMVWESLSALTPHPVTRRGASQITMQRLNIEMSFFTLLPFINWRLSDSRENTQIIYFCLSFYI